MTMSRRTFALLRLVLLLFIVGALFALRTRSIPEHREATEPAVSEPSAPPTTIRPPGKQLPVEKTELQNSVGTVTLRDDRGNVVFRGEVDVSETLARIERGERLRFRNDGSVFENRERRLPGKSRGYYREFVHPTPGLDGPGPQRLVLGKAGETYYTPDHYRSFRRLDKQSAEGTLKSETP